MAIYMKINGVNGGVTTDGYKNTIELLGISFGATRHIRTSSGNTMNREAGLLQHSEASITKAVDTSSGQLHTALYKNKVYPSVRIDVCHGLNGVTPLVSYTLENVMISHAAEATGGDGLPIESLVLNFTSIEKKYTLKDKTGKVSASECVGYDLVSAKIM